MNKKNWMIIALIVGAVLIGIGIFFYIRNNNSANKEDNYEANRTSATNTTNGTGENTSNAESENPETNSTNNEVRQGIAEAENNPPPVTEEQIATFTTKIYSNDSARQNNISITCNTLNGTIVKNGETFSFCGTVGQASSSKGYQKADIFDKNGNKKKGLGGRKLPNQFYSL